MKKQLLDGISSFSCAKDSDLEAFLKNKAITYERLAKCRTYLFVNKDTLANQIDILAYFSVGIRSISISKGLSNNFLRKLDGYSDKIYNERIRNLPAYLIGQLAKNDNFASDIKGDEIIQTTIQVISEFYSGLGGISPPFFIA